MAASRLYYRTLFIFQQPKQLWTPVSSISRCKPTKLTNLQLALTSCFSLTTQNLDAFSPRPVARAKLLFDGLLGGVSEESKPPDIIFLQEVTSDVCNSILANPKVRKAYLTTDAVAQTSLEKVTFANMTLLSRQRFAFDLESQKDEIERGEKFILGLVSRVELPSKYGRCALSVDIIPPFATSTTYRLINVHLDSLGETLLYRTEQMEILANLLHEPGCAGGLIAGDFNAISPEDHALLDKNGLVDAWVALHGNERLDGATWGVGMERRGLGPGRLDKIGVLGIEAKEMEILCPSLIEVPKPGKFSDYIPCSNHYGRRLRLAI